jgi:mRNA interferase MazF
MQKQGNRLNNLLQGEIWMANLSPVVGHEQANTRPCLVISDNRFNRSPAGLVVIVPLTSQKKNVSWHLEIMPPEGGLLRTSYIICEQIRTISIERITPQYLGNVDATTLEAVKRQIKILLTIF